jgi:hypothetical protein
MGDQDGSRDGHGIGSSSIIKMVPVWEAGRRLKVLLVLPFFVANRGVLQDDWLVHVGGLCLGGARLWGWRGGGAAMRDLSPVPLGAAEPLTQVALDRLDALFGMSRPVGFGGVHDDLVWRGL